MSHTDIPSLSPHNFRDTPRAGSPRGSRILCQGLGMSTSRWSIRSDRLTGLLRGVGRQPAAMAIVREGPARGPSAGKVEP